MNVFRATPRKIKEAGEIIKNGGLVAFPTETVYGLGADAMNSAAVAAIFEIKKRPHFDPLIVHIQSIGQLEELAAKIPSMAFLLIEKFWPGPLTLVLKKRKAVPDLVTSGLPTVAVRMPHHPVALKLIKYAGTPIAAPSANPFNYLSPTRAEHVWDQLGDHVDMILDGGACQVGVESTVLDLSGKQPTLLRPGGLDLKDIESIIGRVKVISKAKRPHSPGQMSFHYAPHAKLRLIRRGPYVIPDGKRIGYLAFDDFSSRDFEKIEILSKQGNLREAAARLFECLHCLDRLNLDEIWAEEVPKIGLGLAIMDRLKKAAAKN